MRASSCARVNARVKSRMCVCTARVTDLCADSDAAMGIARAVKVRRRERDGDASVD